MIHLMRYLFFALSGTAIFVILLVTVPLNSDQQIRTIVDLLQFVIEIYSNLCVHLFPNLSSQELACLQMLSQK